MNLVQVGKVRDAVCHTLLKGGHKDAAYAAALFPSPLLKRMAEWKAPRKHDTVSMERRVNELLEGLRKRASADRQRRGGG